ncbi:MAG TPA: methionine gamma-lyase family protein [Oscillospiraceae bacterium]|nr:methionine gamma-lyase family protein [Oscillospiraceae bacterium]HPF55448.1 methionine gamma-lyase family protein [Clostridiales bacterium]HPK36238.1 methionine gamma-lyase family protein [Oscillospiraceae bacterium]HPR75494.1 methionine gamma-lyase family protein [Oscillospiraceae bacterium]
MNGKVLSAAQKADQKIKPQFEKIEQTERICTERVLKAFSENRVSEAHLLGTTGYGYGDLGRETLDRVYASVYGTEDAFVRVQMVSGTHAIATGLFGVLRPGDQVLSITGQPYDTILPTILKKGGGSLADFGIQFDWLEFDGTFDLDKILKSTDGKRMIYIQRSRGYTLRRSLTSDDITEITNLIHAKYPDIIVFVDNCYGEFVCESEPEADLLAGSLIKNAGGGLCPCGGYLAGKKELIDACADRLFAQDIGREVGATLFQNRSMFMGLFMAPHATAEALKTSAFAAALFDELGFETEPAYDARRADIVQLLKLGNPDLLIKFCKGLQSGSPVDSHVSPEPWDMPGYDSKVIMAAGGFISGSSVEISADAPLREPFAVWLQGGLTFASGRYAVLRAAEAILS